MNTFACVAGYALRDLARSRWLAAYALLLLASTEGVVRLSGGSAGALAGVTSLVLLILPLVSLVFGLMYLQASRDFIDLLLAQPVSRLGLYGGLYAGLAAALAGVFLAGCGLPLLLDRPAEGGAGAATTVLLAAGVLLTLCFLSLGFLVAALVRDRVKALGAALVGWLLAAVLFDALLLVAVSRLQDYPLERPLMVAILLDPIDLARVLVLLRLDAAALLGYTGAVFQEVFGAALGTVLALGALVAWAALPLAWALRRVQRADY